MIFLNKLLENFSGHVEQGKVFLDIDFFEFDCAFVGFYGLEVFEFCGDSG